MIPVTPTRAWLARCLTLAALMAIPPLLPGCVTASGGGAAPRGEAGTRPDQPEGRAEGESADELDARKDRLVREHGDVLARAAADPAACERLCAISTSICGLQEKLCEIADDHPADPHYQDLCREARRDCQKTQDSCVACVESNQAHGSPAAAPPGSGG